MNKEMIYDILNGYYESDDTIVYEGMDAENEFQEGRECAVLYEKVYQARLRLSQKLGRDEDPDVEAVVNGMNDIGRILAYRMYEYGSRVQVN